MTIFVGNLNRTVREEELSDLFAEFGEVKQVKIIKEPYTGESKGFAFVDMMEPAAAETAINELNDTEFAQKKIVVNQARPRTSSTGRSGGNGGGFNRERGERSERGGNGGFNRRNY